MVTTILAIGAVVALCALSIALLDRIAAAVAEHKSAELLTTSFGTSPFVRVYGVPFLTQALRGRYGRITVSAGGLRIGDMTGALLTARIVNAYLPARALLGRRVTELPCERVEGELVLPYGELSRVTGIPYLGLHYEDGRLMATAALPVPGFSALAKISGEAILSIVGSGAVWLRLGGVSVAGIAVPRIVLDQLLGTLSVPIPMPDLPYGLRLTDLKPTPSGLMLCGHAAAMTFRAPREPGDAEPGAVRPG